jgi:CheY-like chemotaxis protein
MITRKALLAATVLIVDDQDANILLIRRLLTDDGFVNVSSTTDPASVAALHAQYDYDLILLDLKMPNVDGFEVMRRLRQQSADGSIPVIALTADPAHKLQALQSGARDFVGKPFDLLELKTRITNMLETRLLYKQLQRHKQVLERAVAERTEELRLSEARFRYLTQLATDWYWEQNERGELIQASGPIDEVLGTAAAVSERAADTAHWDQQGRRQLQENVAARKPFLNLSLTRVDVKGVQERFLVSGEPIFDSHCRFIGYRGVGVEVTKTH